MPTSQIEFDAREAFVASLPYEDSRVSGKEGTMRNLSDALRDATARSNLYCVWIPVRDERGDRLVAIWIDPAMTAFQSCAREASAGITTAPSRSAGHQEEEVDLSAGDR